MRADTAVVARGLAQSRARAKELIEAGKIFCNLVKVKKPSQEIADSDLLTCSGEQLRYVGRGGLKLEHALTQWPISLENTVCLDIGASTGGFTDCMLQNGAAKVFAVDVGHDQLAQRLRQNPQVVSLEGTDIRALSPKDLGGLVDFISIDVSFISLELVLPAALLFLRQGGSLVALVKPQFEAGRSALNKQGVVKDPKTHKAVLERLFLVAGSLGFRLCGYCPSGIRGGSGNVEYLLYLKREAGPSVILDGAALAAEGLGQGKRGI